MNDHSVLSIWKYRNITWHISRYSKSCLQWLYTADYFIHYDNLNRNEMQWKIVAKNHVFKQLGIKRLQLTFKKMQEFMFWNHILFPSYSLLWWQHRFWRVSVFKRHLIKNKLCVFLFRNRESINWVSHRELSRTFRKARLVETTFYSSANCMAVSHRLCFTPHLLTPATDPDSCLSNSPVPLSFSCCRQATSPFLIDKFVLDWLQTRNNSNRTLCLLKSPPAAH